MNEPIGAPFAETLHDALAAADCPSVARAWAAGNLTPGQALWGKLAELGVTALAVPEKYDGLGAHPADLVLAFEELGHHAVPGPWIESAAVIPALLAEPELAEHAERWLPDLAAGDLIATVGYPTAPDADTAGLTLFLGESALYSAGSGPVVPSIDHSRRIVGLRAGRRLAEVDPAPALRLGALACAAQLLGCGRALLEQSTAYAAQRTQFGQQIGKFQAVKHQLADVLIALEFARPLLMKATYSLASRDVGAAKVACAAAADRAARVALQVHGAIGYTQEHDLSLWLTRVRALIPAWGTPAEHRARIAEAL